MKIDRVPFDQLQQRGRWKVEFFNTETTAKSKTAFDSVVLQEVVKERRETLDPQAFPEREFYYVGLENVQSITGDLVGETRCTGKDVRSRSKVFYPNDILYGRLRPYLNKVYLAIEPVSTGICSGEFYVLIPNTDLILPDFLRAVLASQYVQAYAGMWHTGSALPRLQLNDLLSIEIPLPPMEIQKSYETYLQNENEYRRKLAAELQNLPQRILTTLVRSLESGLEPDTLKS